MNDYMRHESYSRKEYLIPGLGGRPERTEVISTDDVLNLKIALELTGDVREFLEDQHIFAK